MNRKLCPSLSQLVYSNLLNIVNPAFVICCYYCKFRSLHYMEYICLGATYGNLHFYLLPKIKFIAKLSSRQSCCLCLYFHYIHLLVVFLIFLLSATYGKCSLFSRPHLNSTDLSVQQTMGKDA